MNTFQAAQALSGAKRQDGCPCCRGTAWTTSNQLAQAKLCDFCWDMACRMRTCEHDLTVAQK